MSNEETKKQNQQPSTPPKLSDFIPSLKDLEGEFLIIFGGQRVTRKSNGARGTVTHLGVLIDFPNNFGIQAVIRWDDGKSGYYNASDFARSGDVSENHIP